MKYSFMSFSCPEMNLDEFIALAERIGYDGVEARISAEHKHGIEIDADTETRKTIKSKFDASKVNLCCIATSVRLSNPEDLTENVDTMVKSIDLAGDLGVPRIRIFGGSIPEDISREKAISMVVDSLKNVADQAQKRNVIVCMETHDSWCNPEHVAEVLKQVDHPAIAANWDIMHPVRVEGFTIDQSFEALKPWIKHLHIHDGETIEIDGKKRVELRPVGEGIIDHKRAVERLYEIDYQDYISGEWIAWKDNPSDVYLPRELATMKRYESEIAGK